MVDVGYRDVVQVKGYMGSGIRWCSLVAERRSEIVWMYEVF